ncbi:MAG: hypothetical protein E6Q96_08920 [Cyclobacteriaceae bacterium]|nr:MAG: hypothetical protein E6Q96_08920 [Cyclobacteriaceae bacterium]
MKKLPLLILSLIIILTLASCEFDVATETAVYPDGSLDKTIAVEKTDSANFIFNVSGWESSVVRKEKKDTSGTDSIQYDTFKTFHKKFASAEEANADLSVVNDTVLRVTSKFEKKFRWFYTYITYSETYHKLNKMKLDPEDYFTREDYAFIDRLPAEGQKISKADELYLSTLHDKVFSKYGESAMLEEFFSLAGIVVTTQPALDSLKKRKTDLRAALEKLNDREGVDQNTMLLTALDSFRIPIDQSKMAEFQIAQKKFWKKIGFISTVDDGKFVNRINLPWDVVNTNADSVSGNSLFWAPPTIKFLLKDYTMYGECRRLNWWAVIVSLLVIGFTLYLFIRKSNVVIQFNDRVIQYPRKDGN